MTRIEEINDASETYMNGLFEDGVEIPIEDFENIVDGFISGAEWADNHPINVLHNVNEKNQIIIALLLSLLQRIKMDAMPTNKT